MQKTMKTYIQPQVRNIDLFAALPLLDLSLIDEYNESDPMAKQLAAENNLWDIRIHSVWEDDEEDED